MIVRSTGAISQAGSFAPAGTPALGRPVEHAITQFGVTVCPADWQVIETQAPGFCRIYHITGGGLHYADENGERTCRPGALYLFPETRPYRMVHDPADPLRCLYFHASLLPYLFVQPIEIALEPEHFLEPLLRLLTQTIEDELDPLILHHLFQALVNWLVQTVPLGQLDPPLRHVLDQIQSRYQEPLDNESLGRLSGWQRQHFIRRFKAAIGLTPHRFLIRQRLHQASLLLLAGASVSQAARKSGYADLKPFSKAFRQHYGIAPSHYRHFFRQTP